MGTRRWALLAGCFALSSVPLCGQVFVVGEKTATADISTDFKHTDLPLPTDHMSERGRRDLVRNLEAEQGFAHRALPMGGGITLQANGNLTPGPADYRKMIYQKGQAAAPGDRVVITSLAFKGNSIVIDVNGGPYAKHRFLSHVQLNDAPVVAQPAEAPTGARITLNFEGFIPEVSAPEVKALLEPVIDFGVKSSEQAYADTLPPKLKDSIAAHEVLVGMNHRMVLAALGAPDSKMREQQSGDPNGGRYEEWIYGHVPQTVKFVRFVGDRVTLVEIAALGKPVEIHDKDEMGDYRDPADVREIAMGDKKPGADADSVSTPPPPTLRMPGEAAPPNGEGKVQYPDDKSPIPPPPGSQNSGPYPAQSPTQSPTSTTPSSTHPAGGQAPSTTIPSADTPNVL
jgi:hypothetical protein